MADSKMKMTVVGIAVTAVLAGGGLASADPSNGGAPCAGDELGHSANGAVCIADDAGQLTWMPEGGAAKTIADLQAQGYTVTIDQIGDDPLSSCLVTQVHNAMTTTRRLGSGGTTGGGTGSMGNHHSTTIEVTKTIDVSLDCTGNG
jgi:hypothetical protein